MSPPSPPKWTPPSRPATTGQGEGSSPRALVLCVSVRLIFRLLHTCTHVSPSFSLMLLFEAVVTWPNTHMLLHICRQQHYVRCRRASNTETALILLADVRRWPHSHLQRKPGVGGNTSSREERDDWRKKEWGIYLERKKRKQWRQLGGNFLSEPSLLSSAMRWLTDWPSVPLGFAHSVRSTSSLSTGCVTSSFNINAGLRRTAVKRVQFHKEQQGQKWEAILNYNLPDLNWITFQSLSRSDCLRDV